MSEVTGLADQCGRPRTAKHCKRRKWTSKNGKASQLRFTYLLDVVYRVGYIGYRASKSIYKSTGRVEKQSKTFVIV